MARALVISKLHALQRDTTPLNSMESPAVNRLFRQLASHRFCGKCLPRPPSIALQTWRPQSSMPPARSQRDVKTTVESSWQQRTDSFPQDKAEEFKRYPSVTANTLRGRRERPRRVKMLMRDFIEDSLYNPQYGYFSKYANYIFTWSPLRLQ